MLTSARISAATLAALFEQSFDCVKLVDLEGRVSWMNENGQCLMDVADFALLKGRDWASFWPEESAELVRSQLSVAMAGDVARFQATSPTMAGIPKYWDVTISAVTDENHDPIGCLVISRDITQADLAKRKLDILVAEMRHRVRNTYAMIGGLLSGFARGNPELQDYAKEMNKRLIAICVAQTLFATDDSRCDLRTLIESLAAPFDGEQCRVTIGNIPPIEIDRDSADAVALVVGELAVNASKHGALAKGGSIDIAVRKDGLFFQIDWQEQSNSPITANSREGGQGLSLTSQIVEVRGGSIAVEWQENGLKTTLRLPL